MPELALLTAYAIIKFRNKSECSLTHMLDPTLVKIKHACCLFHLKSCWLKNLLHREYMKNIRQPRLSMIYLFSFLGLISKNSFLLKPFFRENILPHVMTFLGHLSGHKYPAIRFHEWKHGKLLVWKNLANNQL